MRTVIAEGCMLLREIQGYKGITSTECVMQNEFMLKFCSKNNVLAQQL